MYWEVLEGVLYERVRISTYCLTRPPSQTRANKATIVRSIRGNTVKYPAFRWSLRNTNTSSYQQYNWHDRDRRRNSFERPDSRTRVRASRQDVKE